MTGRRRLRRRLSPQARLGQEASKNRQGAHDTATTPAEVALGRAGARPPFLISLEGGSPPTALRPHAPCPMPVAPPWTPVPPTNQAILTRLRELIGDTMYGHIPSSNC